MTTPALEQKPPLLSNSRDEVDRCVRSAVNRALDRLFDRDATLFNMRLRIHERTVAHRLAVYLEQQPAFDGFNIDCEYNRSLGAVKSLRRMNPCFIPGRPGTNVAARPARNFSPDIIIHQRGTQTHNLLIIELKPASRITERDRRAAKFDFAKLQLAMAAPFDYRQSLFIWLPTSANRAEIELVWNPDPKQFDQWWKCRTHNHATSD